MAQFINNKFDPNTIISFSAQFIQKILEFPDGKKTFHFLDTAGQEKYGYLIKIFSKMQIW